MRHAYISIAGFVILPIAVVLFFVFVAELAMFASKYIFSAAAFLPLALVNGQNATANVSLSWYPPNSTWINNLSTVINGTGTYGFIFNSSQDPAGVPYGTYNWCNMPHVRRQEYPRVNSSFELEYVEVVRYLPLSVACHR